VVFKKRKGRYRLYKIKLLEKDLSDISEYLKSFIFLSNKDMHAKNGNIINENDKKRIKEVYQDLYLKNSHLTGTRNLKSFVMCMFYDQTIEKKTFLKPNRQSRLYNKCLTGNSFFINNESEMWTYVNKEASNWESEITWSFKNSSYCAEEEVLRHKDVYLDEERREIIVGFKTVTRSSVLRQMSDYDQRETFAQRRECLEKNKPTNISVGLQDVKVPDTEENLSICRKYLVEVTPYKPKTKVVKRKKKVETKVKGKIVIKEKIVKEEVSVVGDLREFFKPTLPMIFTQDLKTKNILSSFTNVVYRAVPKNIFECATINFNPVDVYVTEDIDEPIYEHKIFYVMRERLNLAEIRKSITKVNAISGKRYGEALFGKYNPHFKRVKDKWLIDGLNTYNDYVYRLLVV